MFNVFASLVGRLFNSNFNYERECINEAVKEEVAKEYDIPTKALDKVEVKPAFLSWDTLGMYIPKIKKIFADIGVYFGRLWDYTYVVAHEYAHAAQDYLGLLTPERVDNYRDLYEANADKTAKKVCEKIDLDKCYSKPKLSLPFF